MADTYDVTIRFECHDPAIAASVVHELITCMRPTADGTALVQNPRIMAAEAVSGSEVLIRDGHDFDVAYRCASTSARDRAYHFVHSACHES